MTSARLIALLCAQLLCASAWAQTVSFDLPGTDVVNRSNVAFLVFGGSCSNVGEQVAVTGPGTFSASAQCRDTGRWEIANVSLTHLSDGALTFTARHLGTAQASRTLRKDTVAPTLSLQQPTNGSSIDAVNQWALPVRGTCGDLNQPVTVRARPASANAPVVERQLLCPSSRSFATTLDVSLLPDGDVQIFVQHRDSAGNTAQQDIILYKDAEPLLVAMAPIGDYIPAQRSASLLVEGTCNKPGEALFLDVTGLSGYLVTLLTSCGVDGTWGFANVSVTDAPDEELTFTATLTHSMTGGFASVQLTAIKDATPPVLSLVTPTHGARVTSSTGTALHVSGTCSESTPVSVAVGGAVAATETPCQAGTFSLQYELGGLPDGDIAVRVLQTDPAGNTARQDLSIQKDVMPASVSVLQPAPGAFVNAANAAGFRFSGTCSEHGSFAELVLLTGAVSASALCVAGSWSVTLSLTTLPEGPLTVRVAHGDTAGNPPAEVSLALVKDVVPPLVGITSPAVELGEKAIINATNVGSLEILGSCSEDGRQLLVSGSLTGAATCLAGAFVLRPPLQGAPDGDLLLHFTLTDAAGNSSTQTLGLFKDVAPPSLTLANAGDPLPLNATTAVDTLLTGACSEHGSFAAPVRLVAPVAAIAACNAGTWSLQVSFSALPDGNGALELEHTDRAGNRVRLTRAYVKDTVAPLLTLTEPGPGFHVSASNAAAVRVAGTCNEEGRAVELSGPVATSVPCTSGRYQTVVSLAGAPDGDVTLRARLTDAVGNATVQDVRVHKDTLPPTLTLTNVGDPVVLNASSSTGLWLMGDCSEHSTPVELVSPVSATAACDGVTWSLLVSLTELPDGNGALELRHRDVAGNAARLTRAYRKDSVAPLLALTRPAANEAVNASRQHAVQVAGTCNEEGRGVEVTAPVAASAPCLGGAFSLTLDLRGVPDGDVAIRTRLRDAAGNETRQDRLVLKDTVVPVLTLANTGDPLYVPVTSGASLVLSGSCSEHSGSAQPVRLVSPVTASAACNAGSWSLQLNADVFPSGPGSLELSHADAAGNSTRLVRAYLKEPPVPQLKVTSLAAGDHVGYYPRIEGTCSEQGRAVELLAPITTSTTCWSGRFTLYAYMYSIPDGPVTLRLRHTNAQGTEVILEIPVTKDSVAPTLTLTQPAGWDLGPAQTLVLQGTCSDPGRPVLIRGAFTGEVSCSETKTFAASFPLTAWGTLKVDLSHRDLAGNNAALSRSFERCVYPPQVSAPKVGPSGRLVEADFNADGVRDMAMAIQRGLSDTQLHLGGVKVYLGRAANIPGGGFEEPLVIGGLSPDSLTVADFNADGALDILVREQNRGLKLVTGRMVDGRPSGTFNPPFTYEHLSSQGVVMATHFNDDSLIDLVMLTGPTNNPALYNSLAVSLGRQACGPGVDFEPQFAVHSGIQYPGDAFAALADFNRDGKTDITYAGYYVPVTVLLRTAATGTQGLFQPVSIPHQQHLPVLFNPVMTADLNGDSFMDIVAANWFRDAVTVNYGRGDGTFTAMQVYEVGVRPTVLVAADIDVDGHTDLIVGGDYGAFNILPGRPGTQPGSGGFGPAVGYPVEFPVGGVLVTDVNGDAIPDLVLSEKPTSSMQKGLRLSIHLRTKARLTADPFHPAVSQGPAGAVTGGVVAADFNADGILDLASASNVGLHILRGQGSSGQGNGTFSTLGTYSSVNSAEALVAADLNEDGALDLAAMVYGQAMVLLGNRPGGVPDGTFAAPVSYPCMPDAARPHGKRLHSGDFNGDGVLDLICDYSTLSDSTGAHFMVLWGRGAGGVGSGTFAPYVEALPPGVPGVQSALAGDFNRDGVTDLALTVSFYDSAQSRSRDEVQLLFGTGTGGAVFSPPVIHNAAPAASALASGDFNADGVPDLLTWIGGGTTSVLLGEAAGGIPTGGFIRSPTARVEARPDYGWGSAVGDFDQDGAADLVTLATNRVQVLRRVTGASGYWFHPYIIYSLPTYPRGLVMRDFNSDGVLDLAFGWNGVSVMLGRGPTAP